jgi:two-component system OmpR family sensor kinase
MILVMRRLSIRWRITIGSVLIAAIFLSGAVFFFRAQVAVIINGTTGTLLMHDADPYLAQIRANPGDKIDTPSRGQLVAITNPAGVVLESNLPKSLRGIMPRLHALPEATSREVLVGDDAYRVLNQTIVSGGGTWHVITARSEESASLLLDRLTTALILGAIALVLGFGVASWLLTSAALRPVTRMRKQAAALLAKRSTEPLPQGLAVDELSALATTLNEFITEVRQSVDREKQLVSDASHELRTPLAILKSQLELAHLSTGNAAALEAEIVSAERSVQRLTSLATGLLELSQIEATSSEALPSEASNSFRISSWNELGLELADAVDRARVLAVTKNVTVDFDAVDAPTESSYRIDIVNFGRLINNLTSNAITAVPEGGWVRIALRHSTDRLELTVVDSGAGMPEKFLPIAFDRFSRPDESRAKHTGGSGLGLAIVHAIVTAAGGSVTLTNAAGFTVAISLPAVPAQLDA